MTRTAIKFGVFVAVCTSFTLWLAFTIGNIEIRDPLGRDNFTLEAAFDDVQGLLLNDEVKIAGVEVGKVTGIRVDDGQAIVTFQVASAYEGRLSVDTIASVRWRNLIGQRYLYLTPPATGVVTTDQALHDGDRVCPEPDESDPLDCGNDSVADLGLLFNRLGPIVETVDEGQVNQFLSTITAALEGNTDRIGQSLEDLADVSESLAARDESISRLIENVNTVAGTITARDQQIRTMLDNLVLLSQTFSDNTELIDRALAEFGSFSTDLSTLIQTNRDELDRIIGNLDVTVADAIIPRLNQLDAALAGLDEASRAIFGAGSNGEWLNQTILCAAVAPPPCATPLITGASTAAAPVPQTREERVSSAGGPWPSARPEGGAVKSFRDRNPYAVGIISVLLLGLVTGAAFSIGLLHLLEDTYTVRAEFDDAAGLKAGNEVKLAGVKVGRVESIEVQPEHGTVIVTMKINTGTELGDNTTAEIALGTLLGAKFVRLDYDAPRGDSLLAGSCAAGENSDRCYEGDPLIPRDQAGNRVPYDVFRLTRVATEGIEQLETEDLDSFVNDLADLTEDRREPVTRLINSIDDVSLAITSRDQQLGELLARAESLSATLAEKDETLVALIDQSRAILQLLEQRRGELTAALGEGAEAVTGLADLIATNRDALDRLLTNLHPTLDVARANLDDINRGLAWAGPAFYGQALAGTHGPWLDIYVRGLGPDIGQILCDILAPGSVCS